MLFVLQHINYNIGLLRDNDFVGNHSNVTTNTIIICIETNRIKKYHCESKLSKFHWKIST